MTEQSNYPRLTGKLLARSKADDYEKAKLEWRITGRVWRDTFQTNQNVINHPSQHPNKCLCGHDITYHFEIENTETNILEIVGSTCINNWMVLRHMTETLGQDVKTITEEDIEKWKTMTVQGLIKDAWWEEEGKDFKEVFNEIKDLDLRVNVRETNKDYWDTTLKMRRPTTMLRKTSSGRYGSSTYKMASIVWRWNHPNNPKSQKTTRGYPNDKLLNDLTLFSAFIDNHLTTIEVEDGDIQNRMEHLSQMNLESKDEIRARANESFDDGKFAESCKYFGFRHFTEKDGVNMWERGFLRSMREHFLQGDEPSEKQAESLNNILLRVILEATGRQKSYLERKGYPTEYVDTLSKSEASELITKFDGGI